MSAARVPTSGASFRPTLREPPARSDFAAFPFLPTAVAAVIKVVSDADLSHVSFQPDSGFERSPIDPSEQLVAVRGLLRHLERTRRD